MVEFWQIQSYCFKFVKYVATDLFSSYRTGSSKDEEDSKSFTDEDWERLNRIIGYKENNEYIPDQQDMKLMQFDFEIRMKHNASRLTIDDSECLADLSCQDFCCNLKMYPEAKIFDLKLGSYRLLSPYGLLAEVCVWFFSLLFCTFIINYGSPLQRFHILCVSECKCW